MLQWRSGVSGSIWRSRVLSHIPLFPLWEKSQAKKFLLALSCATLGYEWHASQFVFFFLPQWYAGTSPRTPRLPQRLSPIKGLPYSSREAGAGSPATAGSTAGTQVCMPTGWARLFPVLFAYSIGSHSSHEETLFMGGCQIVEWGGYKWGTSYLAILLTSLLSCFLKQPVTFLGFLVIGWYLFQFSWPQISMLFVFMLLLLIMLLLWNNFRFSVKLQR